MKNTSTIDLHVHSVYSEGDLTVDALLDMGMQTGLSVMALTDHNTIAGVPEFIKRARHYGITAITGVELYANYQGQPLHLLGYHFDPDNAALVQRLTAAHNHNEAQLRQSVAALCERGYALDLERILAGPSDNYGAIHILLELERHPENITRLEAELPGKSDDFFVKINHFFGSDAPAHFALDELDVAEAIERIHQAGGFASLAHPGQQLSYEKDSLIIALQPVGLDAIEVLSPYHSWHQIEHYQHLALEHGLAITGGSDFHGTIEKGAVAPIDRQWSYFHVPRLIYERLKTTFTNLP